MTALSKAFANADRSYMASKATVNQVAETMLARGPSGFTHAGSLGLGNAKQQLDAFRNWAFAAVRPICNRIAAQEVKVGKVKGLRRYKSVDDVKPLDSHPILDVLDNPNDLQTGYGLRWATTASINLTGRAFWFCPEGEPHRIYLIPCHWVQGFTGTTRFESWKVLPPGQATPIQIPSERMVYFSLPSPSDPWGSVSPLQTCAAAMDNDDDILRSQRSAFKRGMHPSHALILQKDQNGVRPRLTDNQERQLVSALRRRYQSTSKSGEPFIVDGLLDSIQTLSHSPAEMDWGESAKAMKARILEAIGTSPYILGSSEPGSRAASAMAEKHFIASTVNPLIRLMSESLTEWMSPIYASEGERLKIWIVSATADDSEMELKRMELACKSGVMSAPELRRFAGLPEDSQWEGRLVVGSNRGNSPIEAGIQSMILDAMGSVGADGILDQVRSHDRLAAHAGNGDR